MAGGHPAQDISETASPKWECRRRLGRGLMASRPGALNRERCSSRASLPPLLELRCIPSKAQGRRTQLSQVPGQRLHPRSHPAIQKPGRISTNTRPGAFHRRSWGNRDRCSHATLHTETPAVKRCNETQDKSVTDYRSRRSRPACSSLRKSNSMAPTLFRSDKSDSLAPSLPRRAAIASIAMRASAAAMCDKAAPKPFATTAARTDLSD
jgi:hypothetical protein